MARYLVLALGLTALLVFALARAVTTSVAQLGDDVARVFGPGRTRFGGSEFPQAPRLKLANACTPDSWWLGGETVSFTLTTDAILHPTALELYSATDRDDDSHGTASDWALLCAVPVAESLGQALATIPPTHVRSTAVAYRVVVQFRDDKPWWKEWRH